MRVSESDKLPELLKAIHELTGIKVAIFNLDCEEILSYPSTSIDFCRMLHRQEAGLKSCSISEKERCEACSREAAQQTLQCHAGLTQIVIPIMNSGAVVGYIMLGQFVGENERDAFVQQAITLGTEFGLEREEVVEKALAVPGCTDGQMQSVAKIVNVIASDIVLTDLLDLSEKPLKQTILDYIAKNLSEDLSVQALCQKFSVSKSELYRLLRHQAPGGVASYVRARRFERACELLRYTRKPVWKIAAEVGYDDPDYFLRAFKKGTGVSAGKYRKGTQ